MRDMITGLKYLIGMENANILIPSEYRAELCNIGVVNEEKEPLKQS